MRTLITASLLQAVKWHNTCPASWKRRAAESLYNTVTNAPYEPNEWCKRGHMFEDVLQGYSGDNADMKAISDDIRGGRWQVGTSRKIDTANMGFVVYGKCDVLQDDRIIDIKTSKKTQYRSHYAKSYQHFMYCWLFGIDKFRYICANLGDNPENLTPLKVKAHDFVTMPTDDWMQSVIVYFCQYMHYIGLFELYRKHQKAREE